MKKYLSFSFVALTLLFTIITACKKEGTTIDTTAETDNSMAENESNRVIQAVNSTADGYGFSGSNGGVRDIEGFLPACATVTIDTTDSQRTITIDFGSTPCLCDTWDGRYRQGKIIATWSGMYRDSGTVITIVTQDYFQGATATQMNQFDYSKTVMNMGHNGNGNLHYAINVSSAVITLYN
ncbi:MAG: hypothetical protein ACHQD9_05035, partial [Chitinophagales bacterium]